MQLIQSVNFRAKSASRLLLTVFLLPSVLQFACIESANAEEPVAKTSVITLAEAVSPTMELTPNVVPSADQFLLPSGGPFAVTPVLLAAAVTPALAATPAGDSSGSLSQQYTDITKKILLGGIDLERFSLHFRTESGKQPKLRRLRYFAAQETGAACGLAFEVVGDEQFGIGRNHPLQVNKLDLHRALATATIGSTVAGSGSCLELALNAMQAVKNKKHGYDHHTANITMIGKLKHVDALLAEREAMVAAHSDQPGYERAVAEGKILKEARKCFIDEYARFSADTAGYGTFQNLFFALNAGYNAIGAAGAGVAYRAVKTPHLNGSANILFAISGAMAAVSPGISSLAGKYVRQHTFDSLSKQLGERPSFDPEAFTAECNKLKELPPIAEGSLIPSLPATERLALYTQSDKLFREQFDNETHVMRRLEKVALENSVLGPVIGGQLMTQGILGTVGYYRYTLRPRKQLNMYYGGSVVGTVGTSMAVVGNAAWFASSLAYEHKLSKENRLPRQLIEARLKHLDELEKTVAAL